MPQELLVGKLDMIVGDLAAGGEVGEAEKPNMVAALAADNGILEQRRGSGDRRRAERANQHEGAAQKLEILDDPAVEHQAPARIVRIDEAAGVADLVEAFLVEHLGSQ